MIKLLRINIKQTVRQLSMVLLLARATGTCGKQLISAVLVGKRSWPPNALGRLQYILGGISEYYSDWGLLALVSRQFSRLSAHFTLYSLLSNIASGGAAKFILLPSNLHILGQDFVLHCTFARLFCHFCKNTTPEQSYSSMQTFSSTSYQKVRIHTQQYTIDHRLITLYFYT